MTLTIAQSVAKLFRALPPAGNRDAVALANLYVEMLEIYPSELIAAAVDRLVRTERFLPTIAEVIEQAAAVKREQDERTNAAELRAMKRAYEREHQH